MDNKIVLIDGGLASELHANFNVKTFNSTLWAGEALLNNKVDALKRAHLNFINAGSQIITTASYQMNVDYLMEIMHLTREEDARQLLKATVEIAQEARKEANKESVVLIAGSVGALGACRRDGSEYSGNYANSLTIEQMKEWHRPRIECLLEAKCDLLAFETIPSLKEAEALVALLADYPNAKACLSFSCKDEIHLSDGNLFKTAYDTFQSNKQLIAIGINCTGCQYITPLLQSVKQTTMPFIVYPNCYTWNAQTKEFSNDGSDDSRNAIFQMLDQWFALGVKYIGGCCQFNSQHIRQMATQIQK